MLRIPNNSIRIPGLFIAIVSILIFFFFSVSAAHAQEVDWRAIVANSGLPGASTLALNSMAAEAQGGGGWDPLGDAIAFVVYPLALGIGGLFLGIGGLALDLTIQHLIVGMGAMLNSELGNGMFSVWGVIRDLFNLLFIFSFIYLGIKTILNADDSATRKGIINLIFAGLFINFSLFITLTIIDFTNIAATQIYQQILSAGNLTAVSGTMTALPVGSNSISGAFMNAASLGSFLKTEVEFPDLTGMNKVIYALLMMIFFMITAIIFLFATFHIIYRFVALCIYLVISPVLFLGFILPNFKGYTDKWLKGLLTQSFFAPAFLFMIYLSLVVLSALKSQFGGGEAGLATIFEGKEMTPGTFTIILLFALSIGFLYASVRVAEFLGIAGSKAALGAIGRVTFGAAADLGRSTIGQIGYRASQDKTLLERSQQGGIRGFIARRELAASRLVGDASFDMRRVGGLGEKARIGEGNKGGFKTQLDEVKKKEKEYAEKLGEVDEDDPQVARFIDLKTSYEETVKQLQKNKKNIKDPTLEQELEERRRAYNDLLKPDDSATEDKKAQYARDRADADRAVRDAERKIKEFEQKKAKEIDEEIEKAEKESKRMDDLIVQEKNRRQVGSYVDPAKADATKAEFAANKAKIDALKTELEKAINTNATPEDRADIVKRMREANKERKDLAKKAKESEKKMGYAGVLEKRNWFTSMALGRVASQDHDAGKAVRKQFSKGSAKEAAEKK